MRLATLAFAIGLAGCGFGDDLLDGAGGGDGDGAFGGGDSSSDGSGSPENGDDRGGGVWVEGDTTSSTGNQNPSDSSTSSEVGVGGSGSGGTDGLGGGEPEPFNCEDFGDAFDQTAAVVVDDSNSYASPMLVRELTNDASWTAGDPLPVRAHEFLNAYAQKLQNGLLDTEIDEGLHIGADARVHAGEDYEHYRLVELAVTFTSSNAFAVAVPDVTFVMDTDASMDGEGLERLHGVLRGAGLHLAQTQRSVAALTTLNGGTVVRPMTPWSGASDTDALIQASSAVDHDSDLDQAVSGALGIAREQAEVTANAGVVLVVTDGTREVSANTLGAIRREGDEAVPVRVVGVGVGPARGYADEALDAVTDESGGAYFYAPSRDAAEAELAARFSALTQVAARNVKLDLRLPGSMKVVGVAGGNQAGTTTDVEDVVSGQNLGADSTMAFHIYLRVPVEEECPTIGIQLEWDDPALLTHRVFPENGPQSLALYDRLAPANEPNPSLERLETIVAVADALRGPTAVRLGGATDKLNAFLLSQGNDPADPLRALCMPLKRFCTGLDIGCTACPVE